MEERLRSVRDWFAEKADSIHARAWLAGLSFTESCIFIIPPDPLLAAMVFVHRERWVRYALLTTVASVAGALFGYILGALLYDFIGVHVIELYHLQPHMDTATELAREGVFLFTFVMAFTPIPFKVAVLAAGFTKANIFAFAVAALGGRGIRYALIALIAKVFGDNAEHLMKRFWWYATAGGFFVIAFYIVYRLFM